MTTDELQQAVGAFLVSSGVARWMVADSGVVTLATPYAVVSTVSDEDDWPADTLIDADTDAVAFTQHRRARVQVDVIGPGSRALAQRVALLWRADCDAARTIVAAGFCPSRATAVDSEAAVRGGSGLVQAARVDLIGYHRLTLQTEESVDLVANVTLDVEGVSGPDIDWTEAVPPPSP